MAPNSSEILKGEKDIEMPEMTVVESHRIGSIVESYGTKMKIKTRHAQMIAIGGSIGTGLFVGSGQALAASGPAFLFLGYCLTSLLVYGVMTAVVEIGTHLPIEGASVAYYCGRYVSRSLGFALGWLYFYSFGIIVAYEITAASIVIDFWPNNVPISVWITIMILIIVGLFLCPVSIYGECEFWFASIKIIMLCGLLLLSLILMCGGGPNHQALGFRYWEDSGAVKTYLIAGAGGRFTAFLSTWVFAGFAFYFGPELIIFATGEMENPRKNLPRASRQYFIRLIFFYVFSSLAIGVVCSSTAPGLTSQTGNANASPWVIAIKNAGISVLPSIVNAGILTSAWSAGNSYLYMFSRALFSLAVSGAAPKIFTRCTKRGLPIYAVLMSSCLALLAFLNVSDQAGVVFNWFISLTNTAGYTSWILCCITYIRFRKATQIQGISVPYRARVQPYITWFCLPCFVLLLLCNGYTVFYPGRFTASAFLVTYLGIVIFVVLWIGHKIIAARSEPWILHAADLDLKSGLDRVEQEQQLFLATAEESRDLPWWKKALKIAGGD